MKKNDMINAVHDDDLNAVLAKLGMYKDLSNGRISCHFCGIKMDFENIYAIFPVSGKIHMSCNNPTCVKAMMEQ